MDNYNLILIILLFIFYFFLIKRGRKENKSLFLYVGLAVFLILIAVFLFTENYQWVLDQTTINRSFTMVFVLLLGFSGFLFNEKKGSVL